MAVAGDTLLDRIGRFLAGRLRAEWSGYQPYTPSDPETLCHVMQTGDVLLVEGRPVHFQGHQVPDDLHLVPFRDLRRPYPRRGGTGRRGTCVGGGFAR